MVIRVVLWANGRIVDFAYKNGCLLVAWHKKGFLLMARKSDWFNVC